MARHFESQPSVRSTTHLLADLSDVRRIAVALYHVPRWLLVVTLVQAQVLRSFFGGSGTLDDNGLKGVLKQLEVGYVRSGHDHRERATIGLHQKGAFDPVFGSIGGIGAYLVPPKRVFPIAPSAACHSKSTPPNSS